MLSKSLVLRALLAFGILLAAGLSGPGVLRGQSHSLGDPISTGQSSAPKISEFSLSKRSDDQGYVLRAHASDSPVAQVTTSREDSTVVWVLRGATLAKDWQEPTLKGPVSGFSASDTSSQVTARLPLDLFGPARAETYPDRASNDLLLNLEYSPLDLPEMGPFAAKASTTGTSASALPPESLPGPPEISPDLPAGERSNPDLPKPKSADLSSDSASCCSLGKDSLAPPSLPEPFLALPDSLSSEDPSVGTMAISSSGESAAPPHATVGFSPPPGSPLKRIMTPPAVDTIIIDPGHGGIDPGAAAHGLLEKDIVLPVAKRAAGLIERHLQAEVLLTRTTDRFLTLDERARFANSSGGDLFISVHTNGSPAARRKGTEVYVLGPSGSEKAARAMRRENSSVGELLGQSKTGPAKKGSAKSPSAKKFFSGDRGTPMKSGSPERPRSRTAPINERSKRFARILQERIRRRIRPNDPVRQATFEVLWRARMPAVLLELGYLTNPEEAKYLSEPPAQKYLAWQIFRSVKARGEKTGGRAIEAPLANGSKVDDPLPSGGR